MNIKEQTCTSQSRYSVFGSENEVALRQFNLLSLEIRDDKIRFQKVNIYPLTGLLIVFYILRAL